MACVESVVHRPSGPRSRPISGTWHGLFGMKKGRAAVRYFGGGTTGGLRGSCREGDREACSNSNVASTHVTAPKTSMDAVPVHVWVYCPPDLPPSPASPRRRPDRQPVASRLKLDIAKETSHSRRPSSANTSVCFSAWHVRKKKNRGSPGLHPLKRTAQLPFVSNPPSAPWETPFNRRKTRHTRQLRFLAR